MSSTRTSKTQSQGFVTYVVGFMGCVFFPALVTAIAPISVTHFERKGGEVIARAKTNLLFVIPYRSALIEGVTSVDDRFHQGRLSNDRSSNGTTRRVRSEDESFLVITGRNGKTEVPVSPVNIRSTLDKANAFLASPSESRLRLITVANWKFSVIAGGLVSLLTLLYVVGCTIAIARAFARLFSGAPTNPGPPLPPSIDPLVK